MKRGQAFDTMMLVISVIVAIAILGILLGFLGGITIFGKDAKTVLLDKLKKMSQKTYGTDFEEDVQWKKGDTIYYKEIIGSSPISASNLFIGCDNKLCGTQGSGKSLVLNINDVPRESDFISVENGAKTAIAICTPDGISFCIRIDPNGKTATSNCHRFATGSGTKDECSNP